MKGKMMGKVPEWVRSAAITAASVFLVTLVPLLTAEGFDWSQSAIVAALAAAGTAALRTVVSGLIPGGSFGNSPAADYGDE